MGKTKTEKHVLSAKVGIILLLACTIVFLVASLVDASKESKRIISGENPGITVPVTPEVEEPGNITIPYVE